MTSPSTLRPVSLTSTAETLSDARHQRLLDTSRKWVGQTFFGTLLKQMRQSPFKSELFSGGRGGDAFGSLYDQQLAERMSRGGPQKLAQSIVRRIEGAAVYRQHEQRLKQLRQAGLAHPEPSQSAGSPARATQS